MGGWLREIYLVLAKGGQKEFSIVWGRKLWEKKDFQGGVPLYMIGLLCMCMTASGRDCVAQTQGWIPVLADMDPTTLLFHAFLQAAVMIAPPVNLEY